MVLHILNASHWKTTVRNLKGSLGLILDNLYYIAVEAGFPGILVPKKIRSINFYE